MRSGGARFMKHNDEKGTWREIPNKEENAVLKVIRKALRKRKVHVDRNVNPTATVGVEE